MKTIKLIDDGVEKEVQISEESWEALRKSVQNKVWKPILGETFYNVESFGYVSEWKPIQQTTIDMIYNFGNCYKTRKEAEIYLNWLQFWADYRRWSAENGNEGGQFTIYIDYGTPDLYYPTLDINHFNGGSTDVGSMSFKTNTLAEKFIKDIGEDRIMKFMGVY